MGQARHQARRNWEDQPFHQPRVVELLGSRGGVARRGGPEQLVATSGAARLESSPSEPNHELGLPRHGRSCPDRHSGIHGPVRERGKAQHGGPINHGTATEMFPPTTRSSNRRAYCCHIAALGTPTATADKGHHRSSWRRVDERTDAAFCILNNFLHSEQGGKLAYAYPLR